jgi:hypothetical protein
VPEDENLDPYEQPLGLGIQKDDDWFQIDIPLGNVGMRVECLFTDSEGDIDFELYDPLGFPVAVRDSITDNELLVFDRAVPAGTYKIRVYGPGLGNEYDLYMAAYIDDQYEENDTFGAPYDLSLEINTPLTAPTLGDEDWYLFEAVGITPFIQVTLDYIDVNGAIDFQIVDASQNVLLTVDSTADSESITPLEVTAGIYYVRVYGDNLYNNYDMTISVLGDDSYEENDVSADVIDNVDKEIPADTLISLAQFDEDWFYFTVTGANTFLTVNANFTHANGNIDLALYHEDDLNTPIAVSATAQNGDGVRVEGSAGIYYVKITGDNTNPFYKLLWTVSEDDQYEQNDTIDFATDLRAGNGETINGIQFDEDWFEVLAEPGNVRLVVELNYLQAAGNLNITLYDAAGDEVAFEDTEVDNEVLSHQLYPFGTTAETYFIKVSGVGLGTEYRLTWLATPEDDFEGDSGNNEFTDPSDVLLSTEGQLISSTIGYAGLLDEDWYEVKINPGDDGIVIEAFFHHADGNIDLELFSPTEGFLQRSVGETNVERIHYKGGAGTYYLKVFSELGSNAYDLVWNSYKEDNLEIGVEGHDTPPSPPNNDAPDTPRSLILPHDNLTSRGSHNLEFVKLDELTQLDEDWYLVETFADEEFGDEDIFIVDLEFEHIYGDIDVAVYDAAGTLIEQAETQNDGERIYIRDLPVGEYLICVYGYGIVNPKPKPTAGVPTPPSGFDPFEDDLQDWAGHDVLIENTAGDDYYDLADSHARGLANTYSLRWISTVEDRYDEEDPDLGVNDTQENAAVPELINQFDILDADGAIDDTELTRNTINDLGEPVSFQYRSVYTYRDLTQLDDDWFAFTVDTGGAHQFFATILFSSFQASLDLRVYDSGGTLLGASDSEVASLKFIEIEGTGRTTYYVEVVGENLGTTYSLQVRGFFDDSYEENDDTAEADENANITDLVVEDLEDAFVQRDDDFFRVEVPEDQVHLRVYVSSFEALDVEVLDSAGVPLPGGYEQTGGTTSIVNWAFGVISPEAETYYIKVTGSNAGFSYGIEWTYDNVDEYEGFFGNDTPEDALGDASELTRLRLEPVYNPKAPGPLNPIKEFAFDYGLISQITLGSPGNDPFGHAIQEDDDWYAIQIPAWTLESAKKGSKAVQVIKRDYYARLSAEIEFSHVDGDINMEIYDDNGIYDEFGAPLPLLDRVPLARSETANDIESLFARIDPRSEAYTDEDDVFHEALTYYIRVYGDPVNGNKSNDYTLKWDISKDDAYEKLEDKNAENDTSNFVDLAYDLTNADDVSTEDQWLHEIEYLRDVNGDGVLTDTSDGGFTSPTGYGLQKNTDDWYAVVVSEGATQIAVDCRFYSDNDMNYKYNPDDLDIDFEVYFLAGNDGNPATTDKRQPVLIGRSTTDTDTDLFVGTGAESKDLASDITTEITEAATFDTVGAGIYFIRVYYDNRSHPYTLWWDDIGDADDADDSAIIDDYLGRNNPLGRNWDFTIPQDLASSLLLNPYANLDGDPYPNWAEYALALDENVANYSIIGQSIVEVGGKNYYQFEFLRRKEAVARGYKFIVEETENLVFDGTEADYVGSEDVTSFVERATYRCSQSMDVQDKCFFRLTVEEPVLKD